MVKKTEMIELLMDQRMVKFKEKRINRIKTSCVSFEHSSKVERTDSLQREIYTLRATAHSQFYRLRHEPEAKRCRSYQTAMISLADVFYGEIRRELHKLYPIIVNIDDQEDREAAEKIMSGIMEMTEI